MRLLSKTVFWKIYFSVHYKKFKKNTIANTFLQCEIKNQSFAANFSLIRATFGHLVVVKGLRAQE
jgi:hypothetical protein